jgi:Phytanoyl-CoA dioxygenase (PhyH)
MDFDRFHRDELPRRIAAGNGALVAADLRGQPSLALKLTGGASYTYAATPTTVEVRAGDERAHTVVELDAAAWADFVGEIRSVPGLLYAGMLQVPRGDTGVLFRWEPALRTLYYGRPLFDPAALELRDRRGRRLDLATTFTLESPRDDVRHFLAEAGFVVVRGVFSVAEVAALVGEVERLRAAARPGDRRSWWARNAAGEQRLCRLTYTSLQSARIAALNDDARVRGLVAAFHDDFVPAPDRLDGIAAILKNPGIVDGLSDLPWHIDCGMGGHPLMCPVLQVSVLLDAASPATGTLKFLAGSHRFATPVPGADESGLPVVTVHAEAGDCVLHLSDTMHAAPAPTGAARLRRSLVTSFYRPAVLALMPPGKAFNDVLLSRADGHVESLQVIRDALAGAAGH